MKWKKLLETKDLIAFERVENNFKVRIEARNKNKGWAVYKTYNFQKGDDWTTHVQEYVAKSKEETKHLLTELKNEADIRPQKIACENGVVQLELARSYKEDFVEKWNFKIDSLSTDNFFIVRYDDEIKLDIVMHDCYNYLEKEVLNKIIIALGLKDISNRIKYDFFYFKKHSAKRRVYEKNNNDSIVANLEFNIDPEQ
jgi:hypothetical protein